MHIRRMLAMLLVVLLLTTSPAAVASAQDTPTPSPATPPAPVSTQEAFRVGLHYAQALKAGNWTELSNLFDRNGEYLDTQYRGLTGTVGPSQVLDYFNQVAAAFPKVSYTIYGVYAVPNGDSWGAVVIWSWTGVHSGSSIIVGKATNRTVTIGGSDQLSFARKGKDILIVRDSDTYDGCSFVLQDTGKPCHS